MSRVDVVVPCYKYAHYLRACVESVLAQDGVDVRVLIIDDCSPDNTPEVARQLCSEDGRVEYRRHPENRGHIATYNEGLLDWAAGDFVLLLSADDMLTRGALRRAAEVMDARPEVGLVYGPAPKTEVPEGCFAAIPDVRRYGLRSYSGPAFLQVMCTEADNIVPTPTAVVRTSLQRSIGGYRHDLPHTGDMEMWLRCAAYAGVGVIDAAQGLYRVHRDQMSVGYAGTRDLLGRKAAFDTLFSQFGSRIVDGNRLRNLADRNVAATAFWTAARLFDEGDVERCGEYLDLALAIYPRLRREFMWARFACKRLAGPKVWSAVRPLVRRLRGFQRPAMA